MKIGLKLWSTNDFYINHAVKLFEKKVFDYIELFTEPNSFNSHAFYWKDIGIPFILHAPHSMQGLNLSLPEQQSKNKLYCEEIQLYFDLLKPDYIIFHPGILGTAHETIRQINLLKIDFPELFNKTLIENKPEFGLHQEKCIGASVEELSGIIQQTQLKFCFDLGHAICYAAANGLAYQNVINKFLKLQPTLFHLSDGLTSSFLDSHMHLGKGDFNLKWLLGIIPQHASVTIETIKNSKANLNDFEEDVSVLRRIINGTN